MSLVERSFVIADCDESFIDAQIASGRFADGDSVVRAALRLLAEENAKLEQLRADIALGARDFEEGRYTVIDDIDAFVADIIDRGHERSKREG